MKHFFFLKVRTIFLADHSVHVKAVMNYFLDTTPCCFSLCFFLLPQLTLTLTLTGGHDDSHIRRPKHRYKANTYM